MRIFRTHRGQEGMLGEDMHRAHAIGSSRNNKAARNFIGRRDCGCPHSWFTRSFIEYSASLAIAQRLIHIVPQTRVAPVRVFRNSFELSSRRMSSVHMQFHDNLLGIIGASIPCEPQGKLRTPKRPEGVQNSPPHLQAAIQHIWTSLPNRKPKN